MYIYIYIYICIHIYIYIYICMCTFSLFSIFVFMFGEAVSDKSWLHWNASSHSSGLEHNVNPIQSNALDTPLESGALLCRLSQVLESMLQSLCHKWYNWMFRPPGLWRVLVQCITPASYLHSSFSYLQPQLVVLMIHQINHPPQPQMMLILKR